MIVANNLFAGSRILFPCLTLWFLFSEELELKQYSSRSTVVKATFHATGTTI